MHNTILEACVKCLLPCGGCGMSMSRFVFSEVACPFVCCYEDVKYERDFSTLSPCFDGQLEPELVPRLASYVVRLVPCTTPNAPNIRHVTTTLTFICLVTGRGYLLGGTMLNYLPSGPCIGQVIRSKLQVDGENRMCLVSFESQRLRLFHSTPVTF